MDRGTPLAKIFLGDSLMTSLDANTRARADLIESQLNTLKRRLLAASERQKLWEYEDRRDHIYQLR